MTPKGIRGDTYVRNKSSGGMNGFVPLRNKVSPGDNFECGQRGKKILSVSRCVVAGVTTTEGLMCSVCAD